MPRSRVPIRGGLGKSIKTGGQQTTVVQQTIVQQTVKGTVGGGGGISSTIWPLIAQIPVPVLDLAALSTAGIVAFDGTDILTRALAVTGPLSVSNPTGAAGNPTIGFTGVATNVVLAGPTPSFRALTTADIPTLPASKISGLATVATTGLYSDLTGKPTIPADISGLTYATVADETADAPNSSQLLAGTNVTFDTSVPNQLKINATGGGGSSPLTTKGDLFGFDTADARVPVGTDGYTLVANSLDPLGVSWAPAVGAGTVTAVGIADLSSAPIYATSTLPVTSVGTLDITLLTQSAAKIFGGPVSGSAAQPTFRSLASTDIPTLPASKISGLATVATTGLLADLGDVSLTSLSTGQLLTWNGSKWGNAAGPAGANITPDTHPASPTTWDDEFEESSLSGQWTWIQQNTTTEVLQSGSLVMIAQPTGGDVTSALVQTLPVGDCTFALKAGAWVPQFSSWAIAIWLYESLTGKMFGMGVYNNGTLEIITAAGTLSGGYSALVDSLTAPAPYTTANVMPAAQGYWRFQVSGSNMLLSFSSDGLIWSIPFSHPLTTYFTVAPDTIGFGLRPVAAGPPECAISVDWFRRTA